MASLSRIDRTIIIFHTKLRMVPSISNNLGFHSSSCSCGNNSGPTLYECRKLGHNLSKNGLSPKFEALYNIPTGVFRDTTGEILGLGAGKNCFYRNPEYFSFHHMSFYDLNMGLRQYRLPCPKSGRKPN